MMTMLAIFFAWLGGAILSGAVAMFAGYDEREGVAIAVAWPVAVAIWIPKLIFRAAVAAWRGAE